MEGLIASIALDILFLFQRSLLFNYQNHDKSYQIVPQSQDTWSSAFPDRSTQVP